MQYFADGIPMYLNRKSRPADKLWIPKVAAWLPIYVPGYGGNASDVYLADGGRFILGSSSSRIFQSVANYYGIDIRQMRKHYAKATRRSQWVPLVIGPRGLALFAFKARTPFIRSDGATGYIATTCIDHIERVTGKGADPVSICIRLTSGADIVAPMPLHLFEEHRHTVSYFHFYLRMHEII